MRRRLLLLSVLVGLLTLLAGAAGACSSSGGGSAATTVDPSSTANTGATAPPAPTGTIAPGADFRPWWIAGGEVTPGDPRPATGGDDVRAALDALLAGPTPTESAFGAGTGIAGNVVVNSLEVGPDGIATVDFNRKFETADTRPQTAQVVYTLTQFPQVTKVRFLIDGQPNGATGVPPIGRAEVSFPAAG